MGVNHNIVHLYKRNGFSQQQAYDKVSDLLNVRYRRWYIAHSEIPLMGEEIDVQVQQYLKGCQDVILGNINWRLVRYSVNCFHCTDNSASFKSERYFGKENNIVRKTRTVKILP